MAFDPVTFFPVVLCPVVFYPRGVYYYSLFDIIQLRIAPLR